MIGAWELTDSVVVAATDGAEAVRAELLVALAPQVRLMVLARLAPGPAQLGAVDEISEEVLVALAASLSQLKTRTAAGLKGFLSGILTHKVNDFLRGGRRPGGDHPAIRSLDSTVADFSRVGPLWQFLSASGVSPRSALDQAERISTLMEEFARLSAAHREVLTLAFFDQLPIGEIAERMQLSRPAASMLLIRAMQTLRQNMIAGSPWGPTGGRPD
jgi:RNA polymerase sigma factor (sigma-70 family)